MTRVLITGGTGMLGRELRSRLLAKGYGVRIMSRRAPRSGEGAGVEWAQASLEKGVSLAEAVNGAEVVIHAASSPANRRVDVDGTARLLDQARAAGVHHFIYISIVGIDQIGYSYYQHKLAAERLIEASGLSWSILRATQFHYLVDKLLHMLTRLPLAFIPAGWQFQSISAADVAEQLVAAVRQGPGKNGRLPDIGGPELLRLDDMARSWLTMRNMRRLIVPVPIPGKLSAGFRQGLNTVPHNPAGRTTWAAWLTARYANPARRDAALVR